ncbi:choice-of-anchor W domain-containing protein [Aerosakkonemataceae cyanobacterium BLCC-F50]|uniref:Choice-of-anchor W domain-containing protein n=1 Tax=Floridaenema flaviceps BLCC-F50 TaxID=3153642 RepID=A0ABV4XZN2_9CYAN
MINLRNTFFTLAVVGLGAVSVPKAADAFTVIDRTGFTDTDFNNLRATGQFTELFVAESRIGNASLDPSEREFGINDASGTPVAAGDFWWANNQSVNFTLEYTGSLVNYIVGGKTIDSVFSGSVTDIFLRTKSVADSTMALSNLVFEGLGISNLSSSGDDVDYLQISNITAPFTLSGTSLMLWSFTGAPPMRSNLAYQIKVGNSTPMESVPEPGTVGALLAAGVLSVGLKKKQKVVQSP